MNDWIPPSNCQALQKALKKRKTVLDKRKRDEVEEIQSLTVHGKLAGQKAEVMLALRSR